MANFKELDKFLNSLHGSRQLAAGIMGTTSMGQAQIDKLKMAYVKYRQSQDNQSKQEFENELLVAQATSVITDKELDQARDWLDES